VSAEGVVAQAVAGEQDAVDASELEREIIRKERLLTEGIRRLEQQVRELSEELGAARQALEQEREDNMRLRRGAMSDAMRPRRGPDESEPTLPSKALR
jgi:hypothetical protein